MKSRCFANYQATVNSIDNPTAPGILIAGILFCASGSRARLYPPLRHPLAAPAEEAG